MDIPYRDENGLYSEDMVSMPFQDHGLACEELFSILEPTADEVIGSILEASEVTVTPMSMLKLMGNLDGLVMYVDPLSEFKIIIMADVGYINENDGIFSACSAICYDAGNHKKSHQVDKAKYIENTLSYAATLCDTKHTMRLGDYKRFTLSLHLDESLNCKEVKFDCKPAVLDCGDRTGQVESLAESFNGIHNVQIGVDAIHAADHLCQIAVRGALFAFSRVAKNNPNVTIDGVEKAVPMIDGDLNLTLGHTVDIYYKMSSEENLIVCLIHDHESGLTYASSNTNQMIRIYMTPEAAKFAECAYWKDDKLRIYGASEAPSDA